MRVVAVLAGTLAAAIVAAGFSPARGAADATGNLADGGTAKGDISTTAGETDTVGVDLYRGERVNIRWSSEFPANVGLFGPDAAEIPVGLDATKSASVNGWTAPATGHYEFRIASADRTQGNYTLKVRPFWDKTVVVDGSGQEAVSFPMPAASRVKGRVQPRPGASNPSILSLTSPAGSELLVGPVVGTPGLAKLKTINCDDAGIYSLTAQAAAGTGDFRVTLRRAVPRIPLTTTNISNGLTAVSYANDGVKAYFDHTCTGCHSWAGSYTGVRSMAKSALARLTIGNMPLGGPRASPATLSLIKSWIATGYAR
jgi:hypothetical protein